jgi:hypothetical protein
MLQKVAVFAAFIVSVCSLAQDQPNPGQSQQPPANVSVVMPPGPNVYVVSGGLYGLYPLPYLPMAPSQNAAPPQAGTAGISYNTPMTYSGPGYSYSTPLYYSNPASAYYNAAPVVPGPATTVAEAGRQINDLAPSYYVTASGAIAGVAPAPSVAEIAALYRAEPKRSVRVYTNDNFWRLAGSQVIPSFIAANVLPTPPANAPPQAEQAQPQAQPSAPPRAGQAPLPAQTEQAPPPAEATQPQPATEPQAAPPASHAEESGGKTALPATSTLLPLLGSLGLLSGALGLWIARFRR